MKIYAAHTLLAVAAPLPSPSTGLTSPFVRHPWAAYNTGVPPPGGAGAVHPDEAAAPPKTAANPRYADLSFDNYLSSPYFHKINTQYPGLQLIHENPYIFVAHDFLTNDECERVIGKATAAEDGRPDNVNNMREQVGGGSVVRTSGGVVCVDDEVPGVRRKMSELTNVPDQRQLQHLKISRYKTGQHFSKHTDAWPTEGAPVGRGWGFEEDFFGDHKRPVIGCVSSRNKPNHNNFLTVLVYLNDIPSGGGGCTTFPNLGIHGGDFYDRPAPMDSRARPDGSPWDWDYGETLTIHPQKGMALLHFPSILPEWGGICDGNTFHQAEKPNLGHEKFVCQQFIASCPYWDVPDDSMPIGRVSYDTI